MTLPLCAARSAGTVLTIEEQRRLYLAAILFRPVSLGQTEFRARASIVDQKARFEAQVMALAEDRRS
jgi:hypothetical protein